ncbi:hypothetical protein GCM10009547_03440 [Sporichthya brevicatena]|uniref:Uncharacterized protein n=1 Tax=Sporichthya brevicatena TaxID=171442 RepID=A0ABN1G685_9ACTN
MSWAEPGSTSVIASSTSARRKRTRSDFRATSASFPLCTTRVLLRTGAAGFPDELPDAILSINTRAARDVHIVASRPVEMLLRRSSERHEGSERSNPAGSGVLPPATPVGLAA